MRPEEWQAGVRRLASDFLREHQELDGWVERLVGLVLAEARGKKPLPLPLAVAPSRLRAVVEELAGLPPYRATTIQRLRALEELASAWHMAGLVRLPAINVPVRLPRNRCLPACRDHDELLLDLAYLTRQMLAGPLEPPEISSLDALDHHACCALMALVVSGDLLAYDLAGAVAPLEVRHLAEDGVVVEGRAGARRWVFSPLSRLFLLRLVHFARRMGESSPWLFPPRFYQDESRRPRSRGKGVILHQRFSRWLKWLSAQALPADARRFTTMRLVRAARLAVATWMPPALLGYLSGRLANSPLDQSSWKALLEGRRPPLPCKRRPRRKAPIPSPRVTLRPFDARLAEELEQVSRQARRLISGLPRKPHRSRRKTVVRKLQRLVETLPGHDPTTRLAGAAILFFAARLLANRRPAAPRALATDLVRLLELVVHHLPPGRWPHEMPPDQLTTHLAAWMAIFPSPRTRRMARSLAKRFWGFLEKHHAHLLPAPPGTLEWGHPALAVKVPLSAGRVLIPSEVRALWQETPPHLDRTQSTLLLALGYYGGLRRQEALGLQAKDIVPGARPGIFVTVSKTSAGRRYVPLTHLSPPSWTEVVTPYLHRMTKEASDEPLLPQGEELMAYLDRGLARLEATFHSLRHSAATLLTLRLLMAGCLEPTTPFQGAMEKLRVKLNEVHGEDFSPSHLHLLASSLLGPAYRFNRAMVIPVVSKLLGHAEPWITTSTYLHALDLVNLALKQHRRLPHFHQAAAATLLDVSKPTLIRRLGPAPPEGYSASQLARAWLEKLRISPRD